MLDIPQRDQAQPPLTSVHIVSAVLVALQLAQVSTVMMRRHELYPMAEQGRLPGIFP